MTVHEQIQAVAHYDDVRLKSEKAAIYIVTYPLAQAPDRGELHKAASPWLCIRSYDILFAELYQC